MATRKVHIQATTGWTVYAVVVRLSDGHVFDWSDNTFKALASATTPEVAMTSLVTVGASDLFEASIDLATINNTATGMDVKVLALHQAGGSPAPATDTAIGEGDSFQIVAGAVAGGVTAGYRVLACVDVTSTLGDNAHCKVKLLDPTGKVVIDAAATCALNVQRDGAVNQFSVSTSDFGVQNANGYWEYNFANPDFTTDVGYTAIATVISGGVTYQSDEFNFFVWP